MVSGEGYFFLTRDLSINQAILKLSHTARQADTVGASEGSASS